MKTKVTFNVCDEDLYYIRTHWEPAEIVLYSVNKILRERGISIEFILEDHDHLPEQYWNENHPDYKEDGIDIEEIKEIEDTNDTNNFSKYIEYLKTEFSFIDIKVNWHQTVGEFCTYTDGQFFGYVPEEYVFSSGFENYKKWKEAKELEKQHKIMMNYHYTILMLLDRNNFSKEVLNILINNKSYITDYKIMTLKVLSNVFEQNTEAKQFIEELIEKESTKCQNKN